MQLYNLLTTTGNFSCVITNQIIFVYFSIESETDDINLTPFTLHEVSIWTKFRLNNSAFIRNEIAMI